MGAFKSESSMSRKRVGALSACSRTGRRARARRAQAKPLPAPHAAIARTEPQFGAPGAAMIAAAPPSRKAREAPARTSSMREAAARTA